MDTNDIVGLIMGGLISALFLVLGIIIYTGRGDKLLAGWNTMSEAERDTWKKRPLFHFAGVFMIVFAILLFASILLSAAGILMWLRNLLIIILCTVWIPFIIYINTNNKFRNR